MYKFNKLDCSSLVIFEKINGFKPFKSYDQKLRMIVDSESKTFSFQSGKRKLF